MGMWGSKGKLVRGIFIRGDFQIYSCKTKRKGKEKTKLQLESGQAQKGLNHENNIYSNKKNCLFLDLKALLIHLSLS